MPDVMSIYVVGTVDTNQSITKGQVGTDSACIISLGTDSACIIYTACISL